VTGVRVVRMSWQRRAALSLLFWLFVAVLAWLDRHVGIAAQHAAVFYGIWVALQFVAEVLQTVGSAIAVSLEGVVAYLVSAVGWLAGRVASILISTGSIFARVWDGLRIVWDDVLKPALVWLDRAIIRLQGWLRDTLKPIFDFLARVRAELLSIYKRFVQPLIDTIEFIRQLNRVLLAFHIHVLQALDATLQQIEQRIEEPFQWINARLLEIWKALELVMTADGFFQRVTLLRSMGKYAPRWMRIALNRRTKPLSGDQGYAIVRANQTPDFPTVKADMATYYSGGDLNIGAVIDQATERARAFYGYVA
jgi:hypothetical protein